MVNTVCWHLLIINNQAIVPLFTSYIAEKLFYLVQNLKTKIKTFFLQNNTNSDISDYFYFFLLNDTTPDATPDFLGDINIS